MTTPTSRLDHLAGDIDFAGAFEGIWARIGSVGVRTKILGIVLALTLILGLGGDVASSCSDATRVYRRIADARTIGGERSGRAQRRSHPA